MSVRAFFAVGAPTAYERRAPIARAGSGSASASEITANWRGGGAGDRAVYERSALIAGTGSVSTITDLYLNLEKIGVIASINMRLEAMTPARRREGQGMEPIATAVAAFGSH